MNETCPDCGAPLPSVAPLGMCPGCLLKAGMTPPTDDRTVRLGEEEAQAAVPAPGTTLEYFGDYELISEIARGGMGVVYKARQVNLNREVALKMILAGKLADEADIRRFRTEAEAAANLKHPNIVAIHEVGEHAGQHYFSMDYVEGRDLAAVCGGTPLPPNEAAAYVKQIAEAIHFAHQRGTIHRDLKPQNILIDEANQVRITDFGLAKQLGGEGGLTRSGDVMGSPSYMPPEQASGRLDRIGPQTDVYALGAILYELITGRPPFVGATVPEILRQVEQDLPEDPMRLNERCARDLATIALRCLEKQPQRRYHSAQALAEELDRFLAHAPILARPVGRVRRIGHWLRSHPWVVTAMATFVILGLLLLCYGLYSKTRLLEWRQAHPGQAIEPKARAEALDAAGDLAFFFVLWFLVAPQLFESSSKGMDLLANSTAEQLAAIPRPLPPLVRFAHGLIGAVGALFGMVIAALMIDLYVWDGRLAAWHDFFLVYALGFFGIEVVRQALANHRLAEYGSDSRELPAEIVREVRHALATQDKDAARALLAELAPEMALVDRHRMVEALAGEMVRARPELRPKLRPEQWTRQSTILRLAILGGFAGLGYVVLPPDLDGPLLWWLLTGFWAGVVATSLRGASSISQLAMALTLMVALIVGATLTLPGWVPQAIVAVPLLLGFGAGLYVTVRGRRDP